MHQTPHHHPAVKVYKQNSGREDYNVVVIEGVPYSLSNLYLLWATSDVQFHLNFAVWDILLSMNIVFYFLVLAICICKNGEDS